MQDRSRVHRLSEAKPRRANSLSRRFQFQAKRLELGNIDSSPYFPHRVSQNAEEPHFVKGAGNLQLLFNAVDHGIGADASRRPVRAGTVLQGEGVRMRRCRLFSIFSSFSDIQLHFAEVIWAASMHEGSRISNRKATSIKVPVTLSPLGCHGQPRCCTRCKYRGHPDSSQQADRLCVRYSIRV